MSSDQGLTALSPLDGRYAPKLAFLRKICSEYGLIHLRLQVEIRWFQALAQSTDFPEVPALSPDATQFLNQLVTDFDHKAAEKIKQIEQETNHDVKAVEYYLKQAFQQNNELKPYQEFIHFSCTSEDINNIAYALMLKTLRDEYTIPLLEKLITTLRNRAHQFASQSMLSRTHGQPATPTTLGKELANFVYRFKLQGKRLQEINILAKCNGAVGNFNAHLVAYPEVDWIEFSKKFITSLGLSYNPYTTQIEPHDYIAEICYTLAHLNTILIDFCRDMWGYISLNYFIQTKKSDEIGSSTMPHKINPIDFENAEGNLGLANALLIHLSTKLPISRWQRDLTDSTTLRNLGPAFAYTLLAYQAILTGLEKLSINQKVLEADLKSHVEVLAEAVQTVMRKYNLENPYEKLKALTHGQTITLSTLHQFIEELSLPTKVKQQLIALSPTSYTGLASKLAQEV
ncbi:MAG: adenylosuccinate lyase [Gammaproteobacteria bacterium RIFCSPHIGHO2_12_FULL_35_23]|nr:MAG: adenylosuccinate lyase [Gammaproteobacteria bacterium RIFCSPHIGHO2_12_FULL_35_23]